MRVIVVEIALMLLLLSASNYVNEAISNNKQVTWQAWLGIRRSHASKFSEQTHSLPRNSGAAWAMTTHK